MLIKDAAALGRKVAAETRVLRTRREKLATAVITLVKKAGLQKSGGTGWGEAMRGSWQTIQKLLPWLAGGAGAAGLGIGSYLAGRRGAQPAGAGGGGFGQMLGGGAKKPLWNPTEKKMFGRMGINPQEEASRTRAMRDVGAGGLWRAQANKERQSQIRGMFNN